MLIWYPSVVGDDEVAEGAVAAAQRGCGRRTPLVRVGGGGMWSRLRTVGATGGSLRLPDYRGGYHLRRSGRLGAGSGAFCAGRRPGGPESSKISEYLESPST